MAEPVFREMEERDLDEVLEIEKESFSVPWSRDAFEHEMKENKLARYFVCEVDGRVASYAGLWIILDEAHITNIAASTAFRRKGYTIALMEHVEAYLKTGDVTSVTLEVRKSNERAISLYSKLGYRNAGIRPGYYADNNEDAIIMWKDI